VILDRYFHGFANDLNRYAPVPVLKVTESEESAGAAAHIARALLSLGMQPRLFSILGGDKAGRAAAQLLQLEGVDTNDLRIAAERLTITKTRYYGSRESLIGRKQLLLQVDEETRDEMPEDIVSRLVTAAADSIADSGVLVISDYGKGVVSDAGAAKLIATAKKHDVPVICDPKLTGLHRTNGATVVMFEERGMGLMQRRLGHSDDVETAAHLIEKNEWGSLLVLGGLAGVTLHRAGKEPEHHPCRLERSRQMIGLHDAAATGLAVGLSQGIDISDAAMLANAACECVLDAETAREFVDRRRLSTWLDEMAWKLQISER
jgi:D-beta-D-heptose 7-phosphate kinase/D-beta-D-heptose 1-phosphate adenosyltransferase